MTGEVLESYLVEIVDAIHSLMWVNIASVVMALGVIGLYAMTRRDGK